ncbi:MAG: hypothetical protein RL154_1309 [Pseudomonadota bacterium]|jgi:disulfide bond formation protein DsbB
MGQKSYLINTLGLYALSAILGTALSVQLIAGEMPCPLCLLQRMAFIGVGIGLTLNLTNGLKTSNYGIIVVSALLGMAMSTRQVLLHIVPPDLGYGEPLLGMHLYTWGLIAFFLITLISGVLLFLDSQFMAKTTKDKFGDYAVKLFGLVIATIMVLAFLESGFAECPDNPVKYLMLNP